MPSLRLPGDPSHPDAGGDPFLHWLDRGAGRSRSRRRGAAVALASEGPAGLRWLAVRGPLAEAVELVRELRPTLGAGCLLAGDPGLVAPVAARLGLPEPEPLVLMVTDRPPPGGWGSGAQGGGARGSGAREGGARWLPRDAWPAVADLLDLAFPASVARPGGVGVRRWAGVREGAAGPLVAVAAEAWSRPGLGFVGGVAVHPGRRGRGYGVEVCGFVLRELLAEYGRAALLADGWNAPALALYRRLGMRARPLAIVPLRPEEVPGEGCEAYPPGV